MESEKINSENKANSINEKTDPIGIDNTTNDNLDLDTKSSKFLKRGRIFIRNLPFSITEDKLKNLFSKYGEIKEINLPYDNTKKMFRGFCFLQYETKREALIAIKELNGKNLDNRKLDISIAQPKNEFNGLPKIENEQNKTLKWKNKDMNINKKRSASANLAQDKILEKHTKAAAQSGNDPNRTLFIRNLGFNTTEDILESLFSKYGKLKYCLICRNKETNASKGSGFIMFQEKEDLENVLRIYEKYELNQDYSGINPFELEGRNLKLLRSISKDEAIRTKESKKNEDTGDNRNRELLYYGLNNYYDFVLKETEVTEDDKQKRENIIQLKKTNFKKNPNLHVSETRLVLRNLDKTYNEENIKLLFREKTEKFMDELKSKNLKELKTYNKIKKIKQIKLMRDEKILDKDNNPKSKSVAFIEVCDKNFGKWIINNLSNMKVSKNKKKGLIVDFALDDIRKIRNRMMKLDKLKMKNKSSVKYEGEKKNKLVSKIKTISKNDANLELNEKADVKLHNGESINNITDIDKLREIYKKTLSRGKKQRIKKRVEALGHSISVLGKSKEINFGQINKNLIMNKNTFFNKNIENLESPLQINKEKDFLKILAKGKNKNNDSETYSVIRVDKENMNINKKIKNEIKNRKQKFFDKSIKPNIKLIGNKKYREIDSFSREKNEKKKNVNLNQNKKENKNKIVNRNKKFNDYDDDLDDYQMSHYINKIEENLKK